MGIRNSLVEAGGMSRRGVRPSVSRAELRARVSLALIGSALLIGRSGGATSGNVFVESVSDYSYAHYNSIPCDTEGNGFYNGIVNIPGLVQYKNYNQPDIVYDTDFYDPQLTGLADHDDTFFDRVGNAVSFFCGHGSCGDGITATTCTSGANCASGQECVGTPPSIYTSKCVYNSPTSEVFITSSTHDQHGHFVKYGATVAQGGGVAWGESTNSGNWKLAGTNGGANVIVFINSCGLRAPYWTQVTNAFAGAHMIAGAMPVTVNNCPNGQACDYGIADIELEGHRGAYLAAFGVINPAAAVSTAWFSTLDSLTSTPGDSCPDFTSNYQYGGGNGIFGCGCHFVLSQDSTALLSIWHSTYETWTDMQNDNYDATSAAGGIYGVFHCNYDNNTYPFTK